MKFLGRSSFALRDPNRSSESRRRCPRTAPLSYPCRLIRVIVRFPHFLASECAMSTWSSPIGLHYPYPEAIAKEQKDVAAVGGRYDGLANMPGRYRAKKLEVFTIGHSTRPIEQFVEILKANGIKRVIDVRTIPRSRHNPQFNRESLAESLRAQESDTRTSRSSVGCDILRKTRSTSAGAIRDSADLRTTCKLPNLKQRSNAPLGSLKTKPCCADVRRSGPMAMPSFTYR